MKLSILTATYNRGQYLKKIYESIVQNMNNCNMEIEWIIIDDGSTDETKNIVKKFDFNERINIKYIYQQNSGKMNAINKATEIATGDIMVDCDSDDFFSQSAFKIIEDNSNILFKNQHLYALCFLKQDFEGNVSGNKFLKNYIESTMFDLYFKNDIKGEKILVFNSNIRKKYKHELEKDENFITESRMYHKMDLKYKILCINEIIEIGDYREDGYTKNILKIFKKYPNGYLKYFEEILQKGLKGIIFKKKIYILKHYIFFVILKNLQYFKNKDCNL